MTEISPTSALSESLIRQLTRAPYAVFLLVSAADGRIDKKEVKRFEQTLAQDDFSIVRQHMDHAIQSADSIIEDLLGTDTDIHDELHQLASSITAQMPAEQAMAIKQTLWRLGLAVASASGGGILGLGNAICAEERVALEAIRLALELPEPSAST